jgi:NitT/TauT family transport system ATP-binding protein
MGSQQGILQIEDVSVVYEREGRRTVAVEHVNLDVRPGEFLCIVGASGCGKTTLLRAIDGLVQPTSGRIRLHGEPAKPTDERMAMVFQEDSLLPWRTTLENVRLGLELRQRRASKAQRAARNARALECIELVKLKGFESYYPHELSGGMRQRVNLARGFALNPEILLMDEPFAALDAQTREAMQGELLDLWTTHRKTVVFITHQLEEAVYLGDRVVVLSAHPGRVREIIPIDMPRPRDRHSRRSPEAVAYVERIWSLIEDEVYRSLVEDTRVSRA